MPASTPRGTRTWSHPMVSGTLRVYLSPCEPLDCREARALQATVEHFLDALRLGMFPGSLGVIHGFQRGSDGKIDARFDVENLHVGALRILYGMLMHFATSIAPLGTMIAWCEPVGATPNLFDVDAPTPGHRGSLGFDATFSFGRIGSVVPLVVEVMFGRALIAEEKARFDAEIRVWAALVQGGYPERGELPGTSRLDAFTVDYEDGHVLRLSAQEFSADVACLEPLMALVVGWSKTVPVASLETA